MNQIDTGVKKNSTKLQPVSKWC